MSRISTNDGEAGWPHGFAHFCSRVHSRLPRRVHRILGWRVWLSARGNPGRPSLRRKGAETVAAALAIGGVVLVAAAVAQSRDLAFVGMGMIGGGLSISRRLAAVFRL